MTTNFDNSSMLSVVAFAGADAAQFLNGQLTIDAVALPLMRWRRAAYCSRQGRIIACGLLANAPDGDTPRFLFVVAGDVAESVATMLKRFVLRAKVDISLLPLRVGAALGAGGETPALAEGDVHAEGSALVIDEGGGRRLVLGGNAAAAGDEWLEGEILRGVPWVGAATSDSVLPQFVNFELIGGVSFEKGCFVGQEVIARLHHLGNVKSRGFVVRGKATPPAISNEIIATSTKKPVGGIVNCVNSDGEFVAFAGLAKAGLSDSLELTDGSPVWLAEKQPYDIVENEKFKRR